MKRELQALLKRSRNDDVRECLIDLLTICVDLDRRLDALEAVGPATILQRIEQKLDALILQGPALEALKASIGGLDRDVSKLETAVDSQQVPPIEG